MISPPEGVRILMADGRPYENTETCWNALKAASLGARYLGLLPDDALEDKRNEPTRIYADPPRRDGAVSVDVIETTARVDIPDMPILPFYNIDGFEMAGQDCILEVWIEKSTQDDWLDRMCQQRKVNLTVGTGDQSEVRARELAFRAHRYRVPVIVFYISDFDPNGRNMPKALARKIEFAAFQHGLQIDVKVIPLFLTPEQCRQYKLPRTPIKDSDRKKEGFEAKFGDGATELDAMEALHPGEMARLLSAEIDKFYDPRLNERVWRAKGELRTTLSLIERDTRQEHAEDIAALKADFDEITSKLEGWRDRARGLYSTVAQKLRDREPDVSDVEIPRSDAPGTTESTVLYDSKRTYLEQMDHYNAWKDGDELAA
jgi:hypothetical protein